MGSKEETIENILADLQSVIKKSARLKEIVQDTEDLEVLISIFKRGIYLIEHALSLIEPSTSEMRVKLEESMEKLQVIKSAVDEIEKELRTITSKHQFIEKIQLKEGAWRSKKKASEIYDELEKKMIIT
jgi:DNA-directed RNA polymerase subunit L